MDDPAIYPVSGGSEAMESALKLVRSYHLARGETERWIVFARWGSYHGNTLGALDLSGRKPLRRPYEAWLGRFRHVSAAYPYRAGEPGANALGDADELAAELERSIEAAEPGDRRRVRGRADRRRDARRRRPAGRLLAGDRRGLPPARRPARRRRGHDRFRAHGPLVRHGPLGRSARTSSSGRRAARPATSRSGSLRRQAPCGMSSSPSRRASSTGSPTRTTRWARRWPPRSCGSSRTSDLVDASAAKGERLQALLRDRLGGHPNVGEIRGRGLLIGARARGGPRDARSLPARRSRDRGDPRGRARGRPAALLGHGPRGRHERRRASCSGRRSSSPTTSSSRSPTG